MIQTSLIWNIHGVGNSGTRRFLKDCMRSNKVDLVAILEPMVSLNKAPVLGRYLNCRGFAHSSSPDPKIWVFWRDDVNLEVIASSSQFLTLGLIENNSLCTYISFVYASCSPSHRQILFQDIVNFGGAISIPWLIGGDFNCVLSPSEKMGGGMPALDSMADFNNCLSSAGLIDIGFTGNAMTWTNNRVGSANIKARLDRVLVNNPGLFSFP